MSDFSYSDPSLVQYLLSTLPSFSFSKESTENELKGKIESLLTLQSTQGLYFNDSLYKNPEFYNPNIYVKLLEYSDLVKSESFSWLPQRLEEKFYYDRIGETQKEAFEKKEKDRERVSKEPSTTKFVPSSKEIKKSRWQ